MSLRVARHSVLHVSIRAVAPGTDSGRSMKCLKEIAELKENDISDMKKNGMMINNGLLRFTKKIHYNYGNLIK